MQIFCGSLIWISFDEWPFTQLPLQTFQQRLSSKAVLNCMMLASDALGYSCVFPTVQCIFRVYIYQSASQFGNCGMSEFCTDYWLFHLILHFLVVISCILKFILYSCFIGALWSKVSCFANFLFYFCSTAWPGWLLLRLLRKCPRLGAF